MRRWKVQLLTPATVECAHRAAGASALAWLPQPLLREVLDLALPLTPCKVALR